MRRWDFRLVPSERSLEAVGKSVRLHIIGRSKVFDLFPRTDRGKNRCVLRQKYASINSRERPQKSDINLEQSSQEESHRDTQKLDVFCAAFPRADAETVEVLFGEYLKKTISIRDTNVRNARKENFYHGILLGLLSRREDWIIDSNAKSGDGFSDILIEAEEEGVGIVIEIKYAGDGNLDAGCRRALAQIEEKGYDTKLTQNGMKKIVRYGIACCKKNCRVMAVCG